MVGEMLETQIVVGAYLVDNGKVLLIHHNKLNLWLPVGGHIEKNETPDEAVLREAKEEVGLDVEFISADSTPFCGSMKKKLAVPFHVNVHSVGDHDHCCLFYVCKVKSNNVVLAKREVKGYGWFSEAELEKPHIPEDVRKIAKTALKIAFCYAK